MVFWFLWSVVLYLRPSYLQLGRCRIDVTGRESLQDRTQLGKLVTQHQPRGEKVWAMVQLGSSLWTLLKGC